MGRSRRQYGVEERARKEIGTADLPEMRDRFLGWFKLLTVLSSLPVHSAALDWATQREQFGKLARARQGRRMPPDRHRCLSEFSKATEQRPKTRANAAALASVGRAS